LDKSNISLNKLNLLKNFYKSLEKKFESVNKIYPQILCKTGCNRCCKFYGSPEIYDFEWENIESFIKDNFSQKDLKRIHRKLLQGLENSTNDIESEENSECPFIYKNMCSIYENRPFICRAFGYSKIKDKVLTCSEELNNWDNINSQYLPQKENLEKNLLKINNSLSEYKTTIYWLKKYFENEKIDT